MLCYFFLCCACKSYRLDQQKKQSTKFPKAIKIPPRIEAALSPPEGRKSGAFLPLMNWYEAIRPLLFALPAETAHRLTFRLIKIAQRLGLWQKRPPMTSPISLWGIPFPHRLGLAAGLDKDGELLPFWAHLGFAFVEVGTVTPRPQPGNPKPRLFRIPKDYALLNRYLSLSLRIFSY
jgi:hypothetical protein